MSQVSRPNRSEYAIRGGMVNPFESETIECESGILNPPKLSHEMLRPRNVEIQSPLHPNPKAWHQRQPPKLMIPRTDCIPRKLITVQKCEPLNSLKKDQAISQFDGSTCMKSSHTRTSSNKISSSNDNGQTPYTPSIFSQKLAFNASQLSPSPTKRPSNENDDQPILQDCVEIDFGQEDRMEGIEPVKSRRCDNPFTGSPSKLLAGNLYTSSCDRFIPYRGPQTAQITFITETPDGKHDMNGKKKKTFGDSAQQ